MYLATVFEFLSLLPLINTIEKRPLLVLFRCFLKDVKSNVVNVPIAVNEHVGHLLATCWTV